jgi:predicted Rossmann fold flavoprotein
VNTAALAPRADVIVVGAGAAGLATAIFTRRLAPAVSLRLLDTAGKPGAKILVSGGSRCNVTNRIVRDADYWGGRRTVIRHVLRALPVPDTIAFFDDLGVPLHEEADGKLFPVSNRSRDVLDALIRELQRLDVPLESGCRVVDVQRAGDAFSLTTSQGIMTARTAVLATGGLSLPKTGSDGSGLHIARRLGHTIVETTPALAPLVLDPADASHRDLSGVAVDAEITIWIDGAAAVRLRGPLLWTHFGVSGPAALNASRHWERARLDRATHVEVTASFGPGEFDEVDARLTALAAARPRASVSTGLAGWLPASFASALLRRVGVDGNVPFAHLSRADRRRISHALVKWPLPVIATRGYGFAEVTAGGVDLGEIDPSTMESRVCAGLFFAGEILDVDGRLGGFNFQWAWASAAAAARGIAGRLAAQWE